MDKLLTLPSGTPQKMDTHLKTDTYKQTFCPYHSRLQSLFLTLIRADTTLRIRWTFILIALYMATIVCTVWPTAELARFSCFLSWPGIMKFFKVVKFGQDLDVIKRKNCLIVKETVSCGIDRITGLFWFSEHNLQWPCALARGSWKLLPVFFLLNLHIINNLLTWFTQSLLENLRLHLIYWPQSLSLRFPCYVLTLGW